jgi:hypothetical protein
MEQKQLIDANEEAKVGDTVIRNRTGAGIAVVSKEDGSLEIVACCIGEEPQ